MGHAVDAYLRHDDLYFHCQREGKGNDGGDPLSPPTQPDDHHCQGDSLT